MEVHLIKDINENEVVCTCGYKTWSMKEYSEHQLEEYKKTK